MRNRVLLLMLTAGCLLAQAIHSISFSWINGPGNPAGTTVTIFRLTGVCPATVTQTGSTPTGFTLIAGGLAGNSYTDSTVAGGTTYCYVGESVNGSSQSAPSNTLTDVVPSLFPPQMFQVTSTN